MKNNPTIVSMSCNLGNGDMENQPHGIAELPLSPESKLVMYADNIQLYRPIRQPSGYQFLQQDEALGNWTDNNYLTLILTMVFLGKRHPVPAPTVISDMYLTIC